MVPKIVKPGFTTALVVLSFSLIFSQTCPDPPTTGFARQTLIAAGVAKQPIEMAVTKDGRVFVAERAGIIRVYTPSNGQNAVAAQLDVYLFTGSSYKTGGVTTNSNAYDVGGVLGVAVSPAFATDNWIYVYYAPRALANGLADDSLGRLTYRLSRFQVLSNNQLNLSSEQILFEIPSIWETHNGGSLHFGRSGDLYLSTGDNDCPSCNNQYSPMDERPGHQYADDQRSTANTNSLLGKILRIHPVQDSVNGKLYTIPAGNLFPVGKDSTLPEIYTMGHRNPYRIFPDPITGRLYIGEFGPAATSTTARAHRSGSTQDHRFGRLSRLPLFSEGQSRLLPLELRDRSLLGHSGTDQYEFRSGASRQHFTQQYGTPHSATRASRRGVGQRSDRQHFSESRQHRFERMRHGQRTGLSL